jgi:hypothetical protein
VLVTALGGKEPEKKLARRLKVVAKLAKGDVKAWKELVKAVKLAYRSVEKEQGGDMRGVEVLSFLSYEERREHRSRGSEFRGSSSRVLQVATGEWHDFQAMNQRVESECARGMGSAAVKQMYHILQEVVEARVSYNYNRNMALWRCAQLREKHVREGLLSFRDMYEVGLVGGGESGLTVADVRKVVEEVCRKQQKQGGGNQGQQGRGQQARGQGRMVREVTSWPNGEPLIAKNGATWMGSTCKACAEAGVWPGHHPSYCPNKDGSASGGQ